MGRHDVIKRKQSFFDLAFDAFIQSLTKLGCFNKKTKLYNNYECNGLNGQDLWRA